MLSGSIKKSEIIGRKKVEELGGGSQKEAELLLEIDGLTQALQAQLLGDSDGSEEARLMESLEGRLQSFRTELEQSRSTVQQAGDSKCRVDTEID